MTYLKYLLLLLVTPLVLMAAEPIGKVTSPGPLILDGKAVPATAASSLPLVAGDEIATSSSAATIFFLDKSRAIVAPNSRIRLEPNGSTLTLRVLSGSLDLNRANNSTLKVIGPIAPVKRSAVAASSATPTTATSGTNTPPPRSKKCPPQGNQGGNCQ